MKLEDFPVEKRYEIFKMFGPFPFNNENYKPKEKDSNTLYIENVISLEKSFESPPPSYFDTYCNKVFSDFINRKYKFDFYCNVCGYEIRRYDAGLHKCPNCQELYSCEEGVK